MTKSWLRLENSTPVLASEAVLPTRPGIYAFYISDPDLLPLFFRVELENRPDPNLLYIGKASRNLYQRVWNEECRHKRPGTFFRSVGVMLGYVSPKGGKNFKFSPTDRKLIIDWIRNSLNVVWSEDVEIEKIYAEEAGLIASHCPLLNISGNPRRMEELLRLRAISKVGSDNN